MPRRAGEGRPRRRSQPLRGQVGVRPRLPVRRLRDPRALARGPGVALPPGQAQGLGTRQPAGLRGPARRLPCLSALHRRLSGAGATVGAAARRRVGGRNVNRRPLDLALAVFFGVTIAYGLLFSLPEGLGFRVAPDSPWPPLRSLHGWAVAQEPAHLDPPPVLLVSCLFDAFFQAPVLVFVIYGLLRERPWVRTLGLVYAGAAVTNMFFYFATTFLGPTPPPNLGVYLAFNLPWLIAPALLGLRMLAPAPFGAAAAQGAT